MPIVCCHLFHVKGMWSSPFRLECLGAFDCRGYCRGGIVVSGCLGNGGRFLIVATIRLIDLALGYGSQSAFMHLNGSFVTGSMTAVVGANGAGKSTLLKGLMGFLRPQAGHIEFDGIQRRDLAYLPQRADIDTNFPISVSDTVLSGGWSRMGAFGRASRTLKNKVDESLATVGLTGLGKRSLSSLSTGQRQRVLFARLLVQDCPVLLLDEPFNAVDAQTTGDLLGLIGRWREEGRTVIAVLHDYQQVRDYFPNTLRLDESSMNWGSTAHVLPMDGAAAFCRKVA